MISNFFRRAAVAITLLAIGGCSASPLPEDYNGFDTVRIVAKCRCELRDGIRDYLTSALLDPRRLEYYPQYAELAYGLRNGSLGWAQLRSHLKAYHVDSGTMGVIERYNDSAIAYEFIFDMSEKNSADGGLDFLGPVTGGTFSAGLKASGSLDRSNQRTLNIADSFEELITNFNEGYCGPNAENGTTIENRTETNIVYPITGSLRLRELIGSFLNLNQSGNLTGLTNAAGETTGVPTISENLKFTTKLTGGGNFGFTGLPSPPSFRVSRAGITQFSGERQDMHSLRLIVKLPLESAKRTRTIAEERLAILNRPIPNGSIRDLLKYSAVVDLSLSPEKEYLEAKIQVARNFGIILP